MKFTSVAMGLALALAVASGAPAMAVQGTSWVPTPRSDQRDVVKAINSAAAKNGERQHGLGCFSFWSLKGHRDLVTVNFKTNVSPSACGKTTGFGIQAYRKIGGKWTRVAVVSGPPGSACKWVGKPSAATKRLVATSGVCR
jgi:hypothetical protein